MELLDDGIKLEPTELTKEKLKEKIKVRKEYAEIKRNYGRAKVATIIVASLSVLSFILNFVINGNLEYTLGFLEFGIVLIYIIACFMPIQYSKFSFTLVSLIYLVNLIAGTLVFTNGILLFAIAIRLFILYFMVKGAISGFKVDKVFNKMETLDMKKLA